MSIAAATLVLAVVDQPTDLGGLNPVSFFTTNFAEIGGWSLFIGLCILIVIGAFFETWVPGKRFRRVEAAAAEQSKTLAATVDLLGQAQIANEITKHFFEKTVPKRGEPVE